MQNDLLLFLGLMRRAGKLQTGENGTGQAARGGKARLILLAEDASDNALKRAEQFARTAGVPLLRLPLTKEALADALGVAGGAMFAVCDEGFARALRGKLDRLHKE